MENDNKELIEKIINILFLSGEEIDIDKISKITNQDKKVIEQLMDRVKDTIQSIGLTLIINDNKYIITSNNKYADILSSFTNIEYSGDLTPAALQTITIISYLGEASENDIAFIRGVQSSQIIRNLSMRGLIDKTNNKYKLSILAMKLLGITDVKDLPERQELNDKIVSKLKDNISI